MKATDEQRSFFSRFTDTAPGMALTPINFTNVKLCESLKEAMKPLNNFVPHLEQYLFLAISWVENKMGDTPPYGLSIDEAVAIHMYTKEWEERVCVKGHRFSPHVFKEDSLYFKINTTLRETKQRTQTLAPYLPYLKFFLTALCKLPCVNSTKNLWRGVNANISKDYEQGKKYWWWGISSCSVDIKSAAEFMETSEEPSKFLLQVHFRSHVVDISEFSPFAEKEVILLPARHLRVQGILESPGFTLIDLVEDETVPNMLIGIDLPQLGIFIPLTFPSPSPSSPPL
jgi:hypothetical protein